MKRTLALLLALGMSVSLAACSGTNPNSELETQLVESQAKVKELEAQLSDSQTKVKELETQLSETEVKVAELESKVNSVGDSTSQQQEQPDNEGEKFVELNIGDSITLDFVDFTVEGASWSDVIKPTDTSGVYSYMPDKDDESYFWLYGRMKNTSGNAYSVEDIVSEIIFDDKYTYTSFLIADDGGDDFYGDYVKPLSSVKYYIYVSAPDEIREIYSTAEVKFGFEDNFGGSYYDDFEDCDYLYTVNLNK